jgi:hypothetical protein
MKRTRAPIFFSVYPAPKNTITCVGVQLLADLAHSERLVETQNETAPYAYLLNNT